VKKELVVSTPWGPLTGDGLLIGRISEGLGGMPLIMSRKHLTLWLAGGAVHCQDAASTNGTFVAVRVGGDDDETPTLTIPGGASIAEALAEAAEEAGMSGAVGVDDCNSLFILKDGDAGEPVRVEPVRSVVTLDLRHDFLLIGCATEALDAKPFPTHVCLLFTPAGESDTEVPYVLSVHACQVKTFNLEKDDEA
jgi:hypothetical protein